VKGIEKKNYIIWGATGQAIVIEEALLGTNYYPVAIFDNSTAVSSPFPEIPIFYGKEGFTNWYAQHADSNTHFVVAIGGSRGADRAAIHAYLTSHNLQPFNVIHRSAYFASNATIGTGVQLMAHSTVCARAIIEDCVIINTSASVDHECHIGKGAHIGPGAVLAGCVEVGENTFVGTNATILPRIKIGKNSVIGAGAVITKDVPDNSTVAGNPGKILVKTNK
jgi:sugar O-acyltransferase (sialic acid O-acetyltransferase NeuD family)